MGKNKNNQGGFFRRLWLYLTAGGVATAALVSVEKTPTVVKPIIKQSSGITRLPGALKSVIKNDGYGFGYWNGAGSEFRRSTIGKTRTEWEDSFEDLVEDAIKDTVQQTLLEENKGLSYHYPSINTAISQSAARSIGLYSPVKTTPIISIPETPHLQDITFHFSGPQSTQPQSFIKKPTVKPFPHIDPPGLRPGLFKDASETETEEVDGLMTPASPE